MSEIKFPKKSFRPKQLLHHLAEADEFNEVIIMGVKKDGSLGYQTSNSAPMFLSAMHVLLLKFMLDQIQLNPESTTPSKPQ